MNALFVLLHVAMNKNQILPNNVKKKWDLGSIKLNSRHELGSVWDCQAGRIGKESVE